MKKTIWLINQYASTPETGFAGRQYYFAEELAKLGYQVYLIAASNSHLLRNPVGDFSGAYRVDEVNGFKMIWVKTFKYDNAHSKKRILNWLYFARQLTKLDKLIDGKPDVILYSSPTPVGYLGAEKLAKKLKAKLVFEVRDIWPLTLMEVGGYSSQHPFIRLLQWIENRAYKNADRVVSNLKYAVEHMTQHGMDVKKFAWVANGFSMAEVSNKQALSIDVINRLPSDKFIVGYTGTLGLANTLTTLIETADLLKENDDIAFVIVGHGKEKETLKNKINNLKLRNVYLIDSIPKIQVQSMLAKFDVCYLGLKKDKLFQYGVSPNKLFDYLYSAKPIIYAIDSGNYQPVTEANAGISVEPENPQAIADAILGLYHLSAKERIKLGENARNLAMREYEYGMLAKKLAGLFASL